MLPHVLVISFTAKLVFFKTDLCKSIFELAFVKEKRIKENNVFLKNNFIYFLSLTSKLFFTVFPLAVNSTLYFPGIK